MVLLLSYDKANDTVQTTETRAHIPTTAVTSAKAERRYLLRHALGVHPA